MKAHVWLDDRQGRGISDRDDFRLGLDRWLWYLAVGGQLAQNLPFDAHAAVVQVADVVNAELRHVGGLVRSAAQQALGDELLDGHLGGRSGDLVSSGNLRLG